MLGFLFRGLTTMPANGVQLFDAVTAEARQRHWYVKGEVPDTLDGRFAVLATIAALAIVRLEQLGEVGMSQSVALTERFITVMESEHRELGIGDPTLGKTVRKLVGSLGRRTDLWRSAIAGQGEWRDSARRSVYRDQPNAPALNHVSASLKRFWSKLDRSDADALANGRIA